MTAANEPANEREATVNDRAWKGLYRVGGVAALVAAILFRRWLGAEFSLFRSLGIFRAGPASQPITVNGWFQLLQSNSLVGLVLLNALDLINYALVGLIFLGLYAALRKSARGSMTLAMVLTFTGIAIYFASNQAFALLALSQQYAAAATDAQKSVLLSAGQTLLTLNDPAIFGTGVFWAFNLVTVSGLMISVAMLRSAIFPKVTAYIGILANAFGLGYFFALALDPPLVFIPLSASAPFLLIWYLLVGIKLLKLARPI